MIFHSGALGDFILTWPLAIALGRLYPQSRIYYITAGQKGKLAERVLGVESIEVESGWHGLYAEDAELPPSAIRMLAQAHTIVLFTPRKSDPAIEKLRNVNPEAGILPLHPPIGAAPAVPAVQFILDQLTSNMALHSAVQQILRSIADRGISALHQPQGIYLHPGSGSPAKCWPLDRWIELARLLQSTHLPVHWVMGEVEKERFSADEKRRLSTLGGIVEPPTLTGLLDHILAARLWIGHDSGPAHLAGIMAVPTIVLFGPTDPCVWKPSGPRVHVLQHHPIDQLPADPVWLRCRALL